MLLTTCLYLVVILTGTVGKRKMMIWREGSRVMIVWMLHIALVDIARWPASSSHDLYKRS